MNEYFQQVWREKSVFVMCMLLFKIRSTKFFFLNMYIFMMCIHKT